MVNPWSILLWVSQKNKINLTESDLNLLKNCSSYDLSDEKQNEKNKERNVARGMIV